MNRPPQNPNPIYNDYSVAPVVPAGTLGVGDRIHHWSPTGGIWIVRDTRGREGRLRLESDMGAVRYMRPEDMDVKRVRLQQKAPLAPGVIFPQYSARWGLEHAEVVAIDEGGLVRWRYLRQTGEYLSYLTVLVEGMVDRHAGSLPLDGGL